MRIKRTTETRLYEATPKDPNPPQQTGVEPRFRGSLHSVILQMARRELTVPFYLVPGNCSTAFWDPIKGECLCNTASCAYVDVSRPIGVSLVVLQAIRNCLTEAT